MSNGNVFERIWKLWTKVSMMVMDGKRATEDVCNVLQAIIDGKTLVEAKLTIGDMLAEWAKFYKEVFGLDLDFSGVNIPERKPGFDRLIIVAQGMTPQRLFDKCKELFPSWKYTERSLDEVVNSDRTAKDGAYAIWVRDRVEADEENKNLSANQIKKRGGYEETLEERLLHELKFFKETGKHLDINNWTLCAGSRYAVGYVPSVYFFDDRFRVNGCNPGYSYGGLRSRSVVSQNPPA